MATSIDATIALLLQLESGAYEFIMKPGNQAVGEEVEK